MSRSTVRWRSPSGHPIASTADPFSLKTTCISRSKGASSCHARVDDPLGDRPIGPKARLLNRPHPLTGENQLDQWTRLGLLTGAPGSAAAPKLAVWDDPSTGTREERAKAYLEINCAFCHNPTGRGAFTSLLLEHDREVGFNYGVCKRPIAAGRANEGRDYDIVPGDADASILVSRMESIEAGIKMPEVAKSVAHAEGIALVREWIDNDIPGTIEDCTTSE